METLYDDVLVPTDGSAGMDRVIRHASDLARVHDATVHGLYVLDAGSFSDLPMETSYEGIRTFLEDEGRAALEELETLVDDAVPVETEIREGTPHREIVDYARESDCDVVVMGTHGRSGIDRLLLGSVAERVVRESAVPVLTVRVASDAEGEKRS